MGGVIAKLREALQSLWSKQMDIAIVGLQGAGKTTLVHVMSGGEFDTNTIPTLGFNMKTSKKGRLEMKMWDVGGQPKFRSQWARYCYNVQAILFVVDSSDFTKIEESRAELHTLIHQINPKYITPFASSHIPDDPSDAPHSETVNSDPDSLAIENAPLLVVGNKNDIEGHLSAQEMIDALSLSLINDREVCFYTISAKTGSNLDTVIKWLGKHAK